MRAIEMEAKSGALAWSSAPHPGRPGPGELLIRVGAAGLNRADLVQRAGHYDPPPGASAILGLEVAGSVASVGPGVEAIEPGALVCALLSGGGYAEYVRVPARLALPVPAGWSVADAATLPEAWATAYLNLVIEARLERGERALIHAGGSGVGLAALRLCRLRGVEAVATASAPKREAIEALGARFLDRHERPFDEALAPDSIDVALDPVGAAYLGGHARCLRTGGRLIVIGLMGGRQAPLDLRALLLKRLRLIGSTLRSRPDAEKALVLEALRREVWPAIESGAIKSDRSETFAIERAEEAHARMRSNRTVGKLALLVDRELAGLIAPV